jgi:hypothetical protein
MKATLIKYLGISRITILAMMLPLSGICQTEHDSTGATGQPGFLLATAGYSSNHNVSGIANAIRRPAFMGTLSAYTKTGLWASANYSRYVSALNPTWEGEAEIGFEKTWKDRFDLDFSYGYRLFRGDSIFVGIPYSHTLELSGAWRPENFMVNIDNSLFMGQETNYFLDLSLSYDFRVDNLLFRNSLLVISPTLTPSFGTTYWIPRMIDRTWPDPGTGNPPPLPFVPRKKFDYQNFSFILPVQYSLGNFTLSAAGFYAIPSPELKRQKWTNQSGFLVSLSYALIFQK